MPNVFVPGRAWNAQDAERLGGAIAGNYVFPSAAGGAVTPDSGLAVAVAAIAANEVIIDGTPETSSFAGGTVSLDAADDTDPRRDAIFFDQTGAVGKRTGIPTPVSSSTGPALPVLDDDEILIAEVWVAANATVINSGDITDRRQAGPAGSTTAIIKSADETVNNSSTFQDDDELTFAVDSNAVYLVDIVLIQESASVSPDFKMRCTIPSGAEARLHMAYVDASSIDTIAVFQDFTSGIDMISATFPSIVTGTVYLTTAGTAGDFTIQWAQNSAQADDTTVLKGSLLEYRKVA